MGDLPPCSAVLLAGGSSRRWGGVDKTAAQLGGAPVLRRAVDALVPWARSVAVVAPPDHPARAVVEEAARAAGTLLVWTREDPPGGGPLAGLAAGVDALPVTPGGTVAVLAGDHPFTKGVWQRLRTAHAAKGRTDVATPSRADVAAVGVDPSGQRQPLLAVYPEGALRRRLTSMTTADRPLRDLLAHFALVEVPVSDREALDLDTRADATRAGELLATELIDTTLLDTTEC